MKKNRATLPKLYKIKTFQFKQWEADAGIVRAYIVSAATRRQAISFANLSTTEKIMSIKCIGKTMVRRDEWSKRQ